MAKQILNYLEEHPQASDTLEGITRWWILQQQVSESVMVVHRALELLKEEGYVLERKTPDGQTLYSLKNTE